MPRFTVSGRATAVADHPRTGELVADERLAQLHGMYSNDTCSEYLEDVGDLVAGGGRLRFVFDEDSVSLRITTSYDVTREPTQEEQEKLVEQTLSQWSDGMGSGNFDCFRGDVLSTALAMAILNSEPDAEDLGELFVDAYPAIEDRDVQVEFDATSGSEDELVADVQAAANAGDPNALIELGQRTMSGGGVVADEETAFGYFQQAVETGHPFAHFMLGLCFWQGDGTEQDKTEALKHFQLSADAGVPMGMHFLGECHAEGIGGVEVDLEKAVEWYQKGAELGDPGCLAELGDCLEFGNGIDANPQLALECYQGAFEMGLEAVGEAIERVQSQLS